MRSARRLSVATGSQTAAHRDMRDAVLDELVAVVVEAPSAIPADEIGLGVEDPRAIGRVEHMIEQSTGEAAGTGVVAGRDPADPCLATVVEHPQVGDHADIVGHPHMPGARLGVASVEFGIRAFLFDDEDVDPQPQEVVQFGGGELGETAFLDLHDADLG